MIKNLKSKINKVNKGMIKFSRLLLLLTTLLLKLKQ